MGIALRSAIPITFAEIVITRIRKGSLGRVEAEACKQACLEYVATALPSLTVREVRVLTQSKLAQVYTLDFFESGTMVVKRHCDPDAFNREILALKMFECLGVTPMLTASPDYEDQFLVTEFLPRRFVFRSGADFENVAYALGRMHGFADLCQQHLQAKMGFSSPDLGKRIADRRDPTNRVIHEMIDVVGTAYRSVSIGDIKPEHVRIGTRGCILVDLETFRWDGVEVMDLFQLVMFPVSWGSAASRSRRVSEGYFLGRNEVQKWPVSPHQVYRWICTARKYLDNPYNP